MIVVKRALVSVYDKAELDVFARGLHRLGVEIVSTGGTASFLERLKIPVRRLAEYTGFTEILGGRVKTLHPKVHGALLARRDQPEHCQDLETMGIELIDLAVVNLYPFRQTIEREGVRFSEAIEQIDIGGPAMLRSAAKNFQHVAVVCRPQQYAMILNELSRSGGRLREETSWQLAVEAFRTTAEYDESIAHYLEGRSDRSEDGGAGVSVKQQVAGPLFPSELALRYVKAQELRYGENPHQRAVLYRLPDAAGIGLASAKQLHGKELSYNNLLDMNAAWGIVRELEEPAAAIVKHTNPCGVAMAKRLDAAYRAAFRCDPVSAYGGIVAFNRTVDRAAAMALSRARFVECVVAPGFAREALPLLRQKKNLRLVAVKASARRQQECQVTMIDGGALTQESDRRQSAAMDVERAKVVTRRKVTVAQRRSLVFAWVVAKHAKSNAIVIVKGSATVGIGAGQTSRVGSVEDAVRKAGARAKGAGLASDGFFPMADGLEVAAKAGVRAAVHPGGSIRDAEVIAAADRHGIAMLCTGVRHFKH